MDLTYKQFIDNILQTRGRFNCGEEYHEHHHILPKCVGGTVEFYGLKSMGNFSSFLNGTKKMPEKWRKLGLSWYEE